MRVVLVASNRTMTPFPVYPIGLDYVATALRRQHELRVVDFAADDAEAELVACCRDFRPEVVGLSIRNVDSAETSNPDGFIPDIERIVGLVRRESSAALVLGGPGFSIFPTALMARLGADYGVLGEGERLPDLLAAIRAGDHRRAAELPGVLAGATAKEPPPPCAAAGRRELASAKTVGQYLRWGGMLNVQTKRGCPFRCSYCTYPAIEGRPLRLREPEQVAEEWQALVQAGAQFLFVTDAVFNSHVRHNLAVADALGRRGLAAPWGAFFAPLRPPPGYYRRLRAAGLSHAEFGTESLAPAMLRAYRKPFTAPHALAAHREARAAGLFVAHYLLLGGPGETRQTVTQTLDECDRLDDAALFFFCGVRIYPRTELHAVALAEGQVDPGDDLLAPRFYAPAGLPVAAIAELVAARSGGRRNWVIGSGDARMAAAVKRMYQRGRIGPLWELLVSA